MYLNNSICTFKPLFQIDYNIKQNILSCCLFKLVKSYKNFDKYLNGLEQLNSFVENNMQGFRIRLFIDNNIYTDNDIMAKLKTYKYVDIVLFNCPNFIVDKYHDGLFGTLVRFFPMFDFECNDADNVCIIDADFSRPNEYLKIYESYLISNKLNNDINLYFYGNLIHIAIKYSLTNNSIVPYAVAWKIFSKSKINNNLLINYIDQVKNNSDIQYSDYIEKKGLLTKTNFVFGVDEYFINNILIKYYIDNEKCISYTYHYQIHYPLFAIYNSINKLHHTTEIHNIKLNNFETIIDFIVSDFKNIKLKNLHDKYKFIDNIVYLGENYCDINKKSCTNLYFYINYKILFIYSILRKLKLYDIIHKNMSNMIFKINFGYIMIENIEYLFCKQKNNIQCRNIKLPKKFLDKILKILSENNTNKLQKYIPNYITNQFIF